MSMREKKADIMILGAQKAGTTSLNIYLSQHPNVFTHNTQEYGLFRDDDSFSKGTGYFYDNTVDDDIKKNQDKNTFIAKRVGLMYDRERLLQLWEYNPTIKVVIVLRNPIDRAFSAFWYCRNAGIEPYNFFEDAVYKNDIARFKGNEKHMRNCDYIERSFCVKHLKTVFKIFPKENIQVFLFEEMITDLNKFLNEICNSIGLPHFQFDTSIKYNEQKQSKSQAVSTMFSPAKKNFLASIMPMKLKLALKKKIKNAALKDVGKNEKKEMQPETREYLKNIFMNDVRELAATTSLPVKKYWTEFFK